MRSRKKVVILGANFAGIACARRLSSHFEVTVIDASGYFEFLPNIHELLSGVKSADVLRLPRRRLVETPGHTFVCETATAVDTQARCVELESGQRFDFDACVVAVGGVNNTLGVRGAEQFSLPFKSVDDCVVIAQRLRDLLTSGKKTSVVIIGAGLEGVEALGEILRGYRNHPRLAVHVVESGEQILPGRDPRLGDDIQQHCADFPVTFHLGESVAALAKTRVKLASGRSLPSDVTLWTAGAKPSPLLFSSGLAPTASAWAAVTPTLQSCVAPTVFVIGDAAALPDRVSKQAYHALDMGAHAAGNVRRFLAGVPLKPFSRGLELGLIALGDVDTYLTVGQRIFAGPSLAAAKELVFQANMARLDPPLGASPAIALGQRYWRGLHRLALPALRPAALRNNLSGLRVIAG
jgi:NADH dehydrogenase